MTMESRPSWDEKLMLLGPLFIVLGLLLLGANVHRYVSWQGALTAETAAVASERGPTLGATFTIVVDGARYECPGGDKFSFEKRTPIVYDPSDPSRCREKAYRDGLGDYERISWIASVLWIIGGVFGFALARRVRAARMAAFDE